MENNFMEQVSKNKFIINPNMNFINNTSNYKKKCGCGTYFYPFDEKGRVIATTCLECKKENKVYEEQPMIERKRYKTKMCFYLEKCKNKNCNFAHTQEELVILPCKFGKTCMNQDCKFKH